MTYTNTNELAPGASGSKGQHTDTNALDFATDGAIQQAHADLNQAVQSLFNSLATPGEARCLACDTTKPVYAGFVVAGYTPNDPTHPAIAYLVCKACLQNPKRLKRAMIGIETISRARAESGAQS